VAPRNRRVISGPNPDFASPLTEADQTAIREAIEERAAIREFEGGESREIAELQARWGMRVYRYRLTDKADTWLTLIAPRM
jgi:hypothetical protein